MSHFSAMPRANKAHTPARLRLALVTAERRVSEAKFIGWEALESSWQGEVDAIREMLLVAVQKRQVERAG